MSGILRYLSFWDWPASLCTMSSGFVRVVACVGILFLFRANDVPLYIFTTFGSFVCPPVDNLGCFRVLVVVNSTALNVGVRCPLLSRNTIKALLGWKSPYSSLHLWHEFQDLLCSLLPALPRSSCSLTLARPCIFVALRLGPCSALHLECDCSYLYLVKSYFFLAQNKT